MKILIAIANYGSKNDDYLSRVLSEYRRMPYQTDFVVFSNVAKDLGPDVEVRVGLPDKDPWSLPFGHKQLFAERGDRYDLFLYSEDDILVTQRNIDAYLRATEVLSPNQLAGFFRFEEYADGRISYPDVRDHFHWVPGSLKKVREYTFAEFTNEHSACYLLTREQLGRALASGGFLVAPHEGKHDLLVTAATDPYTQCGFRKLICVSHLEDFLVAHLPNKYLDMGMGIDVADFDRQVQALLHQGSNGSGQSSSLLEAETKLFHYSWSKDYYEPCREDIISLLPTNVRSVLSIGCGYGATETELVRRRARVVGIPLDSVIAVCAEARGVEMVYGDLESALARLAGEQFDGILISGILHLLPNPMEAIAGVSVHLAANGVVLANVPNLGSLPILRHRLSNLSRYRGLGNYQMSGMHVVNRRTATAWFRKSKLKIERVVETVPPKWQRLGAYWPGVMNQAFSSEYIVVGRNQSEPVAQQKGIRV